MTEIKKIEVTLKHNDVIEGLLLSVISTISAMDSPGFSKRCSFTDRHSIVAKLSSELFQTSIEKSIRGLVAMLSAIRLQRDILEREHAIELATEPEDEGPVKK